MEERTVDAAHLDAMRAAATRGARSITSRTQVVADAVEVAMERWAAAAMSRKSILDWQAWVGRVAANAAKRLATAARRVPLSPSRQAAAKIPLASTLPALERRRLRRAILRRQEVLAGRQLEVVLKLCEHEMTLHRAARELAMDRANLRRTFRAALRRLDPTKG